MTEDSHDDASSSPGMSTDMAGGPDSSSSVEQADVMGGAGSSASDEQADMMGGGADSSSFGAHAEVAEVAEDMVTPDSSGVSPSPTYGLSSSAVAVINRAQRPTKRRSHKMRPSKPVKPRVPQTEIASLIGAVSAFTTNGRVSWKALVSTQAWSRYDMDTLKETVKRHQQRHKNGNKPADADAAAPPPPCVPTSISSLLEGRKRQISPSIPLQLIPALVFAPAI